MGLQLNGRLSCWQPTLSRAKQRPGHTMAIWYHAPVLAALLRCRSPEVQTFGVSRLPRRGPCPFRTYSIYTVAIVVCTVYMHTYAAVTVSSYAGAQGRVIEQLRHIFRWPVPSLSDHREGTAVECRHTLYRLKPHSTIKICCSPSPIQGDCFSFLLAFPWSLLCFLVGFSVVIGTIHR